MQQQPTRQRSKGFCLTTDFKQRGALIYIF
jgi:hypothetical protein